MYIILAILMFGILIATHELGHFIAAKCCNVRVNEFSVGMGPAIFKKEKGETLYALRCLPIGGYCAMEGEDEDTGDERSFFVQKAWKKLVILAAGSFTNFLTGFLIVCIIYSGAAGFVSNEVTGFMDGFPLSGEDGLMPGDEIISVNGSRIYYANDFSLYMERAGSEKVNLVIKRDGEKIELKDFPLTLRDYEINGQTVKKYGLTFGITGAGFGEKLKYSGYCTYNFVRMVWMGLSDLFSGRAGLNDMGGPVMIVSTINDVAEKSESTNEALINVFYICAFIAVNLAVMNMLPIPALDGGRIFFIIINGVYGLVTKKRIDPKYEGYVHAIGLVLLLLLMGVVFINDIRRLI